MQVTQLRPLGIGEILDVAIKLYWRNAGALLRLVAVVAAPVQVLTALVLASAVPDWMLGGTGGGLPGAPLDPSTQPVPVPEGEQILAAAAGFLVVTILNLLASIIATAACFKAITDAYLGGSPEWVESLRFATRKLGSVLWVSILSLIALVVPFVAAGLLALGTTLAAGEGGGAIALIVLLFLAATVGAIWLYVSLSVAVPALLTEDRSGTRALTRSHSLVRGRWWPSFALLVVGALLAGIVSSALGALNFVDVGESTLLLLIVNAITSTIATVLTTPFSAAYVAVLYIDLRVRKEGFDIELLARNLGVEPPAVAPEPQSPSARPPYWPPPPGWRPPEGGA